MVRVQQPGGNVDFSLLGQQPQLPRAGGFDLSPKQEETPIEPMMEEAPSFTGQESFAEPSFTGLGQRSYAEPAPQPVQQPAQGREMQQEQEEAQTQKMSHNFPYISDDTETLYADAAAEVLPDATREERYEFAKELIEEDYSKQKEAREIKTGKKLSRFDKLKKHPLVGAAARGIGAVGKGLKGAGEAVVDVATERIPEIGRSIRDIRTDPNVPASDKLGRTIIEEIVGKGALGIPFEVAGGGLMGALEGATSRDEQVRAQGQIEDAVATVSQIPEVQEMIQAYDNLSPEKKAEADRIMELGGNLSELVGMGIGKRGVSALKPIVTKQLKQAGSKIDEVIKLGERGVLKAGEALPSPGKVVSKILPNEEQILQSMNRINKLKQAKFKEMTGESVGEFMNKRGIVSGGDESVEELGKRFLASKKSADDGLDAIKTKFAFKGKYEGDAFMDMLDDSIDFATKTKNLERAKLQGIKDLYVKDGGIEPSKVNEVKRFFERNNKLAYGKDPGGAVKTAKATNIDNAVREWLIDSAEQAGFGDLREINKQTQAYRFLVNEIGRETAGKFGNNAVELTDWMVIGNATPQALGLLGAKKIASSDWFRKGLVKLTNRMKGHQTIKDKIFDIEAIKSIKTPKDMKKVLSTKPGQHGISDVRSGATPSDKPHASVDPGVIKATKTPDVERGQVSDVPQRTQEAIDVPEVREEVLREGVDPLAPRKTEEVLKNIEMQTGKRYEILRTILEDFGVEDVDGLKEVLSEHELDAVRKTLLGKIGTEEYDQAVDTLEQAQKNIAN